MRVRPVSPSLLLEELAERIAAAHPGPWYRVAVDGAPAAAPAELADALVGPLRLRGRPVVRVSADDFLRPASLRLEQGRFDADSYYDQWLDVGALSREVLGPLGSSGSGRVLPSLWDAATDRATRAAPVTVPAGGVLVLDGPLLLGRGLDFDLSVHLWLSDGALKRRTDPSWQWTLPAYRRYAAEVAPQQHADVVVRLDDPRHPAVVEPRPQPTR